MHGVIGVCSFPSLVVPLELTAKSNLSSCCLLRNKKNKKKKRRFFLFLKEKYNTHLGMECLREMS
jgi:hypothetical protein